MSTHFNLKIDEAMNGVEAVQKFEANRAKSCNCGVGYKLILMDINMPVMDGITATELILEKQQEYEE